MMEIKLLGVRLPLLSRSALLENVLNYLETAEPRQVVTPNPEFLLSAVKDESFARALDQADLAVPDGFGLVLAAACQGRRLSRLSGADLVPLILEKAQALNLRVGILLWNRGLSSVQLTAAKVKELYPHLNSAVWEMPRGQTAPLECFAYQPQVLLIALGAPWQELLGAQLKHSLPGLRLVMGVGGAIDFLTGQIRRAPRYWRQLGVEWLWRWLRQPVSRGGRIFNAVFKFPLVFLRHDIVNRYRYRPNVVGFIFNDAGEVLLVNSNKQPGRDFWKLPQGGREAGESDEEALRREMLEELGTADFDIIGYYPKLFQYRWPSGYSLGGYRGQRQSLFILKYTGDRDDIHLSVENKAYQWVPIKRLLATVEPVLHQAYKLFLKKYDEIAFSSQSHRLSSHR